MKNSNSLEIKKEFPQIIIDGVFFQLYQTGIARVWKSLLEEWAENKFAKHVIVLDRADTAPKISGIRYLTVPPYNYNKTDADRQMLQQVCDREKADLFISTYYTTPLSTPSLFVAYDMIPEVMQSDLAHPMWREKHYGIARASGYIAISDNTARDLVKIFPHISAKPITVAHCGVKSTFSPCSVEEISSFKTKYGMVKPYFLIVGASGGYKNTILFLQAFSQFENKEQFSIVCTGASALSNEDWQPFISGISVYKLQLEDEELRLAYGGAVALVYPSKYEGFGLPVLEAIACGCPVITCANASIPEVAGEAALYVNDNDVNGLVKALGKVQKPDVRQTLISAGLLQAKKFSWSKMADIISAISIETAIGIDKAKEISERIDIQVDRVKQQLQEYAIDSPEFLNRLEGCASLYEIDPSDRAVLTELRSIRRQIAEFWLSVETNRLENLYLSNVGKGHQILVKSGIKDEPLTDTEQTFFDELAASMTKFDEESKGINYRIAAMLYQNLTPKEYAPKLGSFGSIEL